MALWSGRFTQQTDSLVQKFSESISYDKRLYPFDIQGSQAHAKMLAKQGIISQDDADKIVAGLNDIKRISMTAISISPSPSKIFT